MNIIKLSISNLNPSSLRVTGFSAAHFKVATWRGGDLLVQMQDGTVLVFSQAHAKRLAAPDFFLVFDDATVPLALMTPGAAQPGLNKSPHVPPFEQALKIKVVKLPDGSKSKAKAKVEDEDDSWADKALAEDLPAEAIAAAASRHALAESVATAPGTVDPVDTDTVLAEEDKPSSTDAVQRFFDASSMFALSLAGVAASQTAASTATVFAGTVSGTIVLGPVVAKNDLQVKVYDAKHNLLGHGLC